MFPPDRPWERKGLIRRRRSVQAQRSWSERVRRAVRLCALIPGLYGMRALLVMLTGRVDAIPDAKFMALPIWTQNPRIDLVLVYGYAGLALLLCLIVPLGLYWAASIVLRLPFRDPEPRR